MIMLFLKNWNAQSVEKNDMSITMKADTMGMNEAIESITNVSLVKTEYNQ